MTRVSPDVAALMDDGLVRALEDTPLAAPFLRTRLISTVENLLWQWLESVGGSPQWQGPCVCSFGSTGLSVAETPSDVDLLVAFSCSSRRVGVPTDDREPEGEPLITAAKFFGEFPGYLEAHLGSAEGNPALHSLSVIQGRVPRVSFVLQSVKFDLRFATLPVATMPDNFNPRGEDCGSRLHGSRAQGPAGHIGTFAMAGLPLSLCTVERTCMWLLFLLSSQRQERTWWSMSLP